MVHHAALHYRHLPDFFAELQGRTASSARALAFTILTAARSGEVRKATWKEVDLQEAVWTIPGDHTKSRRAHRVPLTSAAISILKSVAPLGGRPDDFLFPGDPPKAEGSDKGGAVEQAMMSDNTMRKYLIEDLGKADITVHGFRSAFRDWGAEMTSFPRELLESALAHVLRDKTEAAYQRGDLFDRRRTLMDAWAGYCTTGTRDATATVLPLARAARA